MEGSISCQSCSSCQNVTPRAPHEPFRFGVNLRAADSRADWIEKARRVEDLGFSTLLVPDHLAELLPPLPALVAAASATSTVRIGTFVLNNDFRHPVLLARDAATLDLLSDGRFELGHRRRAHALRVRARPASRSIQPRSASSASESPSGSSSRSWPAR